MPERERQLARERKRRFRERNIPFSFSIPKKQLPQVEERAKELDCTVPEYAKKLIQADMFGCSYVLPPESKVDDLIGQIRAIGNNVNQLTRHVNRANEICYEDIEQLLILLRTVEAKVITTLTLPNNIEKILQEHLLNIPEDKEKIIDFLNAMR